MVKKIDVHVHHFLGFGINGNPAKINVQRREIGEFRGVLGAPGEAKKWRFDGHHFATARVIILDSQAFHGKMSTNCKCPSNSGHLGVVDI